MKDWDIQSKAKFEKNKFDLEKLIKVLLENRGLKKEKDVQEFLRPKFKKPSANDLGVDKKSLAKSVSRIKKAIKGKQRIIIFGDYDVDGITGTAILWESLDFLGANAMPYIPHRIDEGYGLSVKGIENVKKQYPDVKLIITVDNGIVANTSVDFANSLGIDVIISDHHVPGKKLPSAYGIVHSTLICGAAVGWFLSTQLIGDEFKNDHLALVALATVADLMKLSSYNRMLLVEGLKDLRATKRPGLLALLNISGVKQEEVGVYEIGHVIGPRINAMGRLESAMDSLRLICTKNPTRAKELATRLNDTNLTRQKITFDSFEHAKNLVGKSDKRLLFISHSTYEPGVIGLIAGKLSEEFYRPAIVASIGKEYTKASARSVAGFNIIEFIRMSSDFLVDAGGHPGAAGFTVETKKLTELQNFLEKLAETEIKKELLTRRLRIDCELELGLIDQKLFDAINQLVPFGYGNPEPTFTAVGVTISEMRYVGAEQKHLKIVCTQGGRIMNAILFNYEKSLEVHVGDKVDLAYTISENEWNGVKKLEMKLKDIKTAN